MKRAKYPIVHKILYAKKAKMEQKISTSLFFRGNGVEKSTSHK